MLYKVEDNLLPPTSKLNRNTSLHLLITI